MKTSTATIIILVFVALLGGFGWYFYTQKVAPTSGTDGGGLPSGGSFSPLGGGGGSTPIRTQTNPSTDSAIVATTTPDKLPALRQLTTTPVAGAMASTTASSTIVRYVDRGVGHIYSLSLDNNDVATKVTNTTIPRVYEAVWNKMGNAVVLRYIKEGSSLITNFYADIIAPTVPRSAVSTSTTTPIAPVSPTQLVSELRGRYFPTNILGITVSPKGDRIFILSEEGDGVVGYISRFSGDTRTQVFSSPLKQWSIDWNSENTIVLTTKATYGGAGYAYIVDLKKGTAEKLLGPFRALTTLVSPDTTHILYAENRNGQKLITSMLNTKDGTVQETVFRTLPEKCVWSRKDASILFCAVPSDTQAANLPDIWYQGKSLFVDSIWEYDTETGDVRQLSNLLEQSGKLVDATNLFLDPKENYLFFTNKRDLTLWSLDVREQ